MKKWVMATTLAEQLQESFNRSMMIVNEHFVICDDSNKLFFIGNLFQLCTYIVSIKIETIFCPIRMLESEINVG